MFPPVLLSSPVRSRFENWNAPPSVAKKVPSSTSPPDVWNYVSRRPGEVEQDVIGGDPPVQRHRLIGLKTSGDVEDMSFAPPDSVSFAFSMLPTSSGRSSGS